MTRPCTCTGTCKGADGLAEGWVCALKLPADRSSPQSASAPKLPTVEDLRALVKLPEDNNTHICNLETALRQAHVFARSHVAPRGISPMVNEDHERALRKGALNE